MLHYGSYALGDLIAVLQQRYSEGEIALPSSRDEALALLRSGPPSQNQRNKLVQLGQTAPPEVDTYRKMHEFMFTAIARATATLRETLRPGKVILCEDQLWEITKVPKEVQGAWSVGIRAVVVIGVDKGRPVLEKDQTPKLRKIGVRSLAQLVGAKILSDEELVARAPSPLS